MGISAGFMVPHPPLIIPEVGRGEEKNIQKTIDAYQNAAESVGRLQPETIVLLSPHQTMYADYFHISPGQGAKGDFGKFRAGQVSMEVSYDTEFVRALCQAAEEAGIQAGTLGERDKKLDHGAMVPLYFVNQYWTGYQLVRVGLSGLPLTAHYRFGQCIEAAAQILGRNTVVIASGDLSHKLKEDGPYGYQEEGPAYDARIMDVMGRGAFGELLDFSEDFCEMAALIAPVVMTGHGIFWSSMRKRNGYGFLRRGSGKILTSGWQDTPLRHLQEQGSSRRCLRDCRRNCIKAGRAPLYP